jgi:hypothetical protein
MKYQVKIRVEMGAICYRAIRPMMDLYSFGITGIYRSKRSGQNAPTGIQNRKFDLQ